MAYQQEPGTGAQAQQQKAVFISGVAPIKKLHGKVIIKNRLCFFEGNAMLFKIESRLGWIRIELNHLYIVLLMCSLALVAVGPLHLP